MDSFSYLSVLISIILGLGVAHLLSGFAELIKRRDSLKLWWPTPLWMIITFLIHVQTWWALFALRAVEHWSFAAFLIMLLQPVALFMMASLITPRFSGDAPHDLEQLYWREHRWFFAFILAALAASLGKDLILTGHLPEPENLAAHGVRGRCRASISAPISTHSDSTCGRWILAAVRLHCGPFHRSSP